MGHVTHGDASDADHGPADTGDDVIHRVCSLRSPADDTDVGVVIN
jgi:hypothetical protein